MRKNRSCKRSNWFRFTWPVPRRTGKCQPGKDGMRKFEQQRFCISFARLCVLHVSCSWFRCFLAVCDGFSCRMGALSATEIAQSPSGPSRMTSQFQQLSSRQYMSPAYSRMTTGLVQSNMSVLSPPPPPLVNFSTMNLSSNSSSNNLQQSPVQHWNQDTVSMHSIAPRAHANERPANSYHNQGVTSETMDQMQHLPQENYFQTRYEPFL